MRLPSLCTALLAGSALIVPAVGCGPEPSLEQHQDPLVALSPSRLAALKAPTSALLVDAVAPKPAPAPRVLDASLQLTSSTTATLALRTDRATRTRLAKASDGGTLALQLAPQEEAIQFNDQGTGPDLRAGDGVFAGTIPIDLAQLRELGAEVAQAKTRVVARFAPGTRELVGREEIPSMAIDLDALIAGKAIRLPRLAEIGPLKVLGGALGGGAPINPQKSLIITALPVVEDPARTMNPCRAAAANTPLKKWTFGHLMTEMAQGSGLTPSAFVERWLGHFRTQQIVRATGSLTVLDATSAAAAGNVDDLIINPWRARSGGGALDLAIAPFRLLAILYRPDLARSSPYAGSSGNNAGELRFVFGLMEARDANGDGDALDPGDTCQQHEMSAIFEYGVPITSCTGIKDWANEFVALTGLLQGTPAYGAALESLTERVVRFGAAPTKPNQNALNQLRTNEIALSGIWQMREFNLTVGGGPLFQATVKNNPREHQAPFTSVPGVTPAPIDLNGTDAFRNELLANLPQILAGTYAVPEIAAGAPFLGGATSYNFGTFWDHPALATASELEGRFKFSLNTCSGCHTGETSTAFYHIRPTPPGAPAGLSSFLTVNPFTVTDNRGISHTFSEMDNRKQALSSLANQICRFRGLPPFQILRDPLNSVH